MPLRQQGGSKRCWVLLREEELCVCGFCPDRDLGLWFSTEEARAQRGHL